MKNYYELLDIDFESSREEIEKKLLKLHKKARYQNSFAPNDEKRFEAKKELEIIEEAREILLDDSKRNEYNKRLKEINVASTPKLDSKDEISLYMKTEKTSMAPDKETGIKQTRDKELKHEAKENPTIEKKDDCQAENIEKVTIEKFEPRKLTPSRVPIKADEKDLGEFLKKIKEESREKERIEEAKKAEAKKAQEAKKDNQLSAMEEYELKLKNRREAQNRKFNKWVMSRVITLLLIVAGIFAYLTGGSFNTIDIRDLDGSTKLMDAVSSGSVARVKYTLEEKKANPNRKNRRGRSPLHEAVFEKNEEIITTLIEAGANPNIKNDNGDTPLHLTVTGDIVALLVEAGADVNSVNSDGYTPFMKRVDGYQEYHDKQEKDPIMIMLDAGADLNKKYSDGTTPLHNMVMKSNEYAIEFIERGADIHAKNNEGLTPLHYAAKYGNIPMVKYLLEKGADIEAVDNDGKTALAYSLYNIDMVKLLLSEEADVNHLDNQGRSILFYEGVNLELLEVLQEAGIDFHLVDKEGKTALFNNYYDIDEVKYLVEKVGLDVSQADSKSTTPLHVIKSYRGKIAEYLVSKGADVNAIDHEGRSPLFYDTPKKALLELGADINIVDSYGRTALFYAKRDEDVEILVTAGFDVNAEDHKGLRPLHYVLTQTEKWIDYNLVKALLDLGANVNAEDFDGNTPLETLKKHNPRQDKTQKAFGVIPNGDVIRLLESRSGKRR
ncbi:putative ankyrin repeat protein RF_0381 [Proteiniborus sp. DW1]|uniref:ankyrin repeat domain-containing protein n=1 Tax=Proteiniborus sp. DW1 TaxID=1889883 RepID=UPI00092E1ED6|nr:ankyrin repeat domain-containing protein [Proteiniborus sp. DW1]SCG82370.1 putative ankyrin repeat protein RF_0381 [Proteiniborus sp. DW1]